MWFIYLVAAIAVSVGTGAFLSLDAERDAMTAIHTGEPAVNARQAAQATRALRRLHHAHPEMFPALPTPDGELHSIIPRHLVQSAIVGGTTIPAGVDFIINSEGRIYTALSASNDVSREIYKRVLGRVGPNPDASMTVKRRPIEPVETIEEDAAASKR